MDKLAFKDFDAERAMHLPLGMASPLWLAFSGAAAAGVAFYWMSRWREMTNLEAMMALPATSLEVAIEAAEVVADEVIEPMVEALPEPVEALVIAAMPEPTPEQAMDIAPEPDDLTRLTGIGPKLAASLAERGLTRFEHLAALTGDDIATLDKDMKLMGRIERDAWVAQAKRFAAGA